MKGGPNLLADMDRGGSKSPSGYGPGVQICGGSKSAVTPEQKISLDGDFEHTPYRQHP